MARRADDEPAHTVAHQHQLADGIGPGSYQLGEQAVELAAVFGQVQARVEAQVEGAAAGFFG